MVSDLATIQVCILKEIDDKELFETWQRNAKVDGSPIDSNTFECQCPGKNDAYHKSGYDRMHLCIVKTVISDTYKMIGLCNECAKHSGHIAVFEDSLVDVPQNVLNQFNF